MQLGDSVEFNVTQPLRSVEVNMIEKTSFSTILGVGNFAWLAAALLVNAVTNFEVNALLAKPLNDFAATFGSSIIESGAIFLVLTAGLLSLILALVRVRLGSRTGLFTKVSSDQGDHCVEPVRALLELLTQLHELLEPHAGGLVLALGLGRAGDDSRGARVGHVLELGRERPVMPVGERLFEG